MKELLQEIKLLPSVIGSFIHINGSSEVFSDLPKIFLTKGPQIGQAVDKIFKVNESSSIKANNIEIKFNESQVLAKQIDKDASLITLCEANANLSLVNMTASMLMSELKNSVENVRNGGNATQAPAKPQPQAPPAARPAPEAPPAKKVNIKEILHTGPLAKTLHEFQNALALAIGPIGEMVMKETVEKWAEDGECSKARLSELCVMLCREIDDTALEEEFRQKIKQFLT